MKNGTMFIIFFCIGCFDFFMGALINQQMLGFQGVGMTIISAVYLNHYIKSEEF